MPDPLRIALAQINPHAGAIRGNAERIRRARAEARRLGADIVVTPQLSLPGYPPDDRVLGRAVAAECEAAVAALAAETADGGPALVLGGPWRDGERLHDALFVLDGGRVLARRARHEMPRGGVPDEGRFFDPGPCPGPVAARGARLGLMIGVDWWFPTVGETLAESGAEVLIALDASPFAVDEAERRVDHAVPRVVESGLGFVRLAQVGGQDGLVFDGASFVLNPDRSLALRMPLFEAAVTLTDWRRDAEGRLHCAPQPLPARLPPEAQIYRALMLGLADHVGKTDVPGVVLGLAGGIDSALTAAVAVDALGPERVRAVLMPSPCTSRENLEDPAACAARLGIRCETIGIGPAMAAFGAMLASACGDRPAGTAEQDIASRIRGMTLRALSDASGALLLATADRSGMSLGRAPPCGDIAGGFSVLKDVWASTVVALARWRNATLPPGARGPRGPVMPERLVAQPPDPVPDAILAALVEDARSVEDLVAAGQDRETVLRIARMLDGAERRHRQAAPGVTIARRAFGRDRRHAITQGTTGMPR